MKLFIKDNLVFLWQEKSIKYGIIIYFILFFSIFVFFLLKYQSLPPQVPLFYSRPWGEERLAPASFLLLPLLGCFLLGILNFLLAINFYKKYLLVTRFLIWFNVFLILVGGITVVKIIFLIT